MGDFEEVYSEISSTKNRHAANFWYFVQLFKSLPALFANNVYWRSVMIRNYLRIAFRNLYKHKAYTTINLFGLAIGVACTVLIFLFVADELSFDRYHENADRIFRIAVDLTDSNGNVSSFARSGSPWGPALVQDFPEVLNSVRFRFVGSVLFTHGENRLYEGNGLFADPSVFEVFSFRLLKGDPNKALDKPNAIVINQDLAKRYFGDENPVGQTLDIEGDYYVVTALMENVPHNSHFRFDFLIPFSVHVATRPAFMEEWTTLNYHVYILLKDGQSAAGLAEKLPEFQERHLPATNVGRTRAILQPLTAIHLGSNRSREFEVNSSMSTVYILSSIAFLILLIACINFMNLTTAKATGRIKEVGLRKVVGAQRGQLIGQFMGESWLLCMLSIGLALIMVEIALPELNALTGRPLKTDYFGSLDFLVGLLCLIVFVSLLSGSYPAFYLSSFRPIVFLKGTFRGFSASFLRKALVISQFSASIALIICVGIVYDQMNFIQDLDLGFNKEQVLAVRMRDNNVQESFEVLASRFKENSKVISVAAASGNLGGGDWGIPVRKEGADIETSIGTRMLCIDYEYLETMELTLASGRNFSQAFSTDDDDAFIINETAAAELGFEKPLGQRIQLGDWKKGAIVGIVKDFHFRSLYENIDPIVMFIEPSNFNYFMVRVRPEGIESTLNHLSEVYHEYAPSRPFVYTFLDQDFENLYHSDRRLSEVFAAFALIGIFIACLGLLGLCSYTTEQRTREIGVRKVLGASTSRIMLMISNDFLRLVLLSFIIAAPIAYLAMNSWLDNFAYRTGMDLFTFAISGVLALLVAWLTIGYHSIKAARSNPVTALRYE